MKNGTGGKFSKTVFGTGKHGCRQRSVFYRPLVLALIICTVFYCIPAIAAEGLYSEPIITTSTLPEGTVGVPYSAAVDVAGGTPPYIWRVSNQPSWLSFNQATGQISGTPDSEGDFSIAFLVNDSYGVSYNRGIVLTVNKVPEPEPKTIVKKDERVNNPNLVYPSAGRLIVLKDEAQIDIPANALRGELPLEVVIEKMTRPPDIPSGLRLVGSVYRVTVGGGSNYDFSSPADFGLYADLNQVMVGEKADLYYYSGAIKQWVPLSASYTGKMMQKKVSAISPFAVFAKQTGGQANGALTDIQGHWAEASIRKLVNLGAISGYADGSFGPENLISRAEFTSILVKLYNLTPGDGVSFADTSNHWSKRSIAAAVNAGIVQGSSQRYFYPDEPITREQMAVMIAKAAGLQYAGSDPFIADKNEVSYWARESVASVINERIMSGYEDSRFRPQKYATRAEAASVIAKLK
ncbi:MAG: hypothetical protein HPY50_08015 [Firmicutes bacterium]|nr:hypothetical protein [Bacillota bacterium]